MQFTPQFDLENAKISVDVEGPHHYNIFSESVEPYDNWDKNLFIMKLHNTV